MKKKLLIALTILCVASMAGCGDNTGATTDNNETSTVTDQNSDASNFDESNSSDASDAENDDSKEEESSNSQKSSGLTVVTENLPDYVSAENEDVLDRKSTRLNSSHL